MLQVGYTFPLGSKTKPPVTKIETGGLYWGFEFGGRFAVNRSFAVAPHVGYRFYQSNSLLRSKPDNTPMLADAVVLHMLVGGLTLYISN